MARTEVGIGNAYCGGMRFSRTFSALTLTLGLLTSLTSQAVIRGSLADGQTTKNTVHILNTKTQNICTGVVIHPRILLTAGHCVLNMKPDWFSFTNAGEVGIGVGKKLKIQMMAAEPSYAGDVKGSQNLSTSETDFAVVLFEESALDDFGMSEMDLPYLASTKEKLQIAFEQARDFELIGYGISTRGKSEYENKTDKRRYSLSTSIENDGALIRAKGLQEGQTSCFGDSGGPLFAIDGSQRKTLMGILTSISANGVLAQKHAQERAKLVRKAQVKLEKQLEKDRKNGVNLERTLEKVSLPKSMLAQVCGDKGTVQHAATVQSHLCWVQSVTGIILDPNMNCTGGFQ